MVSLKIENDNWIASVIVIEVVAVCTCVYQRLDELHLCFGGGFTLYLCCRKPARQRPQWIIDQTTIMESLESAEALFSGQYCMDM